MAAGKLFLPGKKHVGIEMKNGHTGHYVRRKSLFIHAEQVVLSLHAEFI
jgi:hypothetical protein